MTPNPIPTNQLPDRVQSKAAMDSPQTMENRISGVFSATQNASIGFGHTRKKIPQNVLFYAEENEAGEITIQQLNRNFIPTGAPQGIEKELLLKNFNPEPSIYITNVAPAMRELNKSIARGERFLRNKESFSAEYEFKKALRVHEENIRATFGLGQTYLDRGDKKRGNLVFRRLVRLEAAFEPQHKHLFNEFGISLRKMGMFVEAQKYYARARKLSRQDEHLAFNMARVLHERGKYSLALKFVAKALELNPDLEEATRFHTYLERKLGKTLKPEKPNEKADSQYEMSI